MSGEHFSTRFEGYSDRDILIRTVTNLENMEKRIMEDGHRRDKELMAMDLRLQRLERLKAMVVGAVVASGLSAWNLVRILLR